METLFEDLKIAARQLAKERGFLAAAGLTLALCIGANVTIFSVVNSVILKPLPVPEPERLLTMWNAYPGAIAGGAEVLGSNGAPDYFDRRALTEVFEEVAVYGERGRSLELGGAPQRLKAWSVTPSLFPLLRAEAGLGRTFTEEESQPGKEQVVLLSDGLWRELFGRSPGAVGSSLSIDGRPYTVVGVMPADFGFLDDEVRLWTPVAFTEEQRRDYHNNNWQMVARLVPGATLERAQSQIDALNARNMDALPDLKPLLVDAGFHTPLFPLEEVLVRDVRGALYLLWGGVAFVLLIGCVNVASLVLVRSVARARELATRLALGARRGRLVRLLLTESVLLSLLAGGAGLLVGLGGLEGLHLLGVENLPRAGQIRLDGTAVAFTVALTLAVAVVVTLIPLASILRMNLSSAFRESGRGGTASRGVRLARKGLVAAQVALALVLLVGAGLLSASFRELLAVDPGFEPEGVLTGTVVLNTTRYPEDADRRGYAERALERVRALPGVKQAGMTSQLPFGGDYSDSVILAEGYVMQPGESVISPTYSSVSPGYFEALGIGMAEGRAFDARDAAGAELVVIVDRRLADRFFPEGGAVGRRMWKPTRVEDFSNPTTARYYTIVGVAEAVAMRGLVEGYDTTGAYYFPLAQAPERGLALTVKTAGEPEALVPAVRKALAEIDPELPFFDVRTQSERIAHSLTDRRTPMLLATGFGAVALLLAAIGIYGMLAYLVELRTREIGIRAALGSDPAGIFRLVLKEGAVILVPGLALGLAGAAALSRVIASQLYGVSPLEPKVLLAVTGVLVAVALAASLLPARRAARIDPVVALAEE